MVKDDGYWVTVVYLCWFLIAFYLGYQIIQSVGLYFGWVEKYVGWYSIASTLGGGVLGALTVWLYVRKPGRFDYHKEVVAELRKVSWPDWPNTKKMTWVVVIVVAVFSAILSVFDLGWSWLLRQILMI